MNDEAITGFVESFMILLLRSHYYGFVEEFKQNIKYRYVICAERGKPSASNMKAQGIVRVRRTDTRAPYK